MALNATTLKNALKPDIEAKIRQYVLAGDATAYPHLTEFAEALALAIATQVVSHITANAVLNNAQLTSGVVNRTPTDGATYALNNLSVTGGIL